VSEIFRNAVFGSNTTIVVGSGSITGVTNNVTTNDIGSLVAALQAHGVQASDLDALKIAIQSDANSKEVENKKLGPFVRNWMGGMVAKAGTVSWEIGVSTAGSVLASAICSYYGIGVV
jgi:hypothetical protein